MGLVKKNIPPYVVPKAAASGGYVASPAPSAPSTGYSAGGPSFLDMAKKPKAPLAPPAPKEPEFDLAKEAFPTLGGSPAAEEKSSKEPAAAPVGKKSKKPKFVPF